MPPSVLRKGDRKLIEAFDPEGIELDHLGRDLSENKNLAKSKPEKLAEFHKELEVRRQAVDAERMEPNPDQ